MTTNCLEAKPGANIGDCISQAIQVAQATRETWLLTHNGVMVRVYAESSPSELYDEWYRKLYGMPS